MAILATLGRSGGISALSRHLDASPADTMAAVNALFPQLLEDFQSYGGGMEGLLELVNAAGGGAMAQAIMSGEPVDVQPGVLIMAKVQGLGAVVEATAPGAEAVDPELRERMLPLLAMLLGGYLSARAMSGGLDMAELASLLDARNTFYSPGEEQV